MGCCNKQRAAGARIAGLPQPSLRQRLSAFFWGGGLISPQEYGLLPSILHSVGGFAVPVAVARGTATGKWPQSSHFPKPLSRHTPLRNAKTTYGIPHAHNSIRNMHANSRHMPCPHAIASDAKPSSIKAPGIGNPVEAPLCSGCNFRRARPMSHPFPSRHIAHYTEGAVQL